jgi:phosphotransferase system enzyme I (PtsP)
MIEVPSVVFQLREILKYCDFISVGTNDLYQFFFACDRGNPRLSGRYDVLSAPFLNMMKKIIKEANLAGVMCSVCGEMASNPLDAMALIGLGFRHLSVSSASYGKVKAMIRSLSAENIEDYLSNILSSSRKTLRPQLKSYAADHAIEIY